MRLASYIEEFLRLRSAFPIIDQYFEEEGLLKLLFNYLFPHQQILSNPMDPGVRRDRERVELYISARKLANLDVLTESDPKCKVFLREGHGQERQIGQTEVLKNNLNPDWRTTFQLDFIFEINQHLRFEVWDSDESVLDQDDLIGVLNTTVGEVMGSRNSVLMAQLTNPKKKAPAGMLYVKGDKVKQENLFCFWEWRGVKIMNVDGWFGKSDPFLRFFKPKGNNEWLLVHETEFVKNNANPIWRGFEIGVGKLCGGDFDAQFKVECWDNQTDGKHQYIGEVLVTLKQIMGENKREFILFNKKEKKPGTLSIQQFATIEKPTFIDYIRGGEQINLLIAVDFTGSNGDPKNPSSLHYNKPGVYNQYQTALWQVSEILLNYDYDKRVPMYGFGGVPNLPNYKKNDADHCFPLTGSFDQPEVAGIEGIMSYYVGALNQVSLSGPTYFGPVIEYASKLAAGNVYKDIYTILMILTDGEIHDMDLTMKLITNAARLPLSIIIIGVGNEKFAQMRTLDGDTGPLKGKTQRDLVQFVAFRECANNPGALAQEVLAELPFQLVAYKQLMGMPPKAAQSMHLSKLG